jgi:hypothetical protein
VFAVVFACAHAFSAQTNVEDIFKEDSTDQVKWSHNPTRVDRCFAISLETAWNGLAGIGPVLHYYPIPNIALDVGAGEAGTGLKTGIRGRVIFSKNTVSGFFGIGYSSGSGGGSTVLSLASTTTDSVYYKLKSTNFLQITGGIDIVAKRGFFFLASIGWSQCLNRNNVVIVRGEPTDAENAAFDFAFRGGLILGMNFGYAIKVR